MRYIVKHIREDRRFQREYGVVDTKTDKVILHTHSRYRAEECAEDNNAENEAA